MAYNLTKLSIKSFNQMYGVNVSLSKIQSDAKTLNSVNAALRASFIDAYKTALMKDLIKKEGESFSAQNMFEDFRQDIIQNFINETPYIRRANISKNLNCKTSEEVYGMLQNVWENIPQNQVEAVMENYLNGNIRIRDMVAVAGRFNINNKHQQNELASYAKALKAVNDTRPLWWRIIHPFRNNAEQREAKNIEAILRDRLSSFADSVFAKVGEDLTHFNEIEKETQAKVRDNEKIIVLDIYSEEFENQLREEYDAMDIEFEPNVTEEEKAQAFERFKIERIKELENEQYYARQQEILSALNLLPNQNNEPVNEENNNEKAIEDKKENIIIEEAKEPSVVIDDNNPRINEALVIDDKNLVK
jgi:hypothetical protein